jgi:ATP-dependent Clp protease ATP-binding subunit ClpA
MIREEVIGAAKLSGDTSAGYTGYGEAVTLASQLTAAYEYVKEEDGAVLLFFDEMDKVNRAVYNIMMTVMDGHVRNPIPKKGEQLSGFVRVPRLVIIFAGNYAAKPLHTYATKIHPQIPRGHLSEILERDLRERGVPPEFQSRVGRHTVYNAFSDEAKVDIGRTAARDAFNATAAAQSGAVRLLGFDASFDSVAVACGSTDRGMRPLVKGLKKTCKGHAGS